MALNPTSYQFKLVEALNAANVPFAAGQYIVEDSGLAYYDPSTGSSKDDRIQLSQDLAAMLTNNVVTGISVAAGSVANEYVFTMSVVDPATGATSTKTFSQQISVATAIESGNALPATSGAVKAYVDTEIATVNEKAEAAQSEVYVVEGAATDDYATLFETKYPEASPKKSDILIFKYAINGTDPAEYVHITYIYDGNEWQAADDSYTADKVYFTSDLVITKPIGIHTIPSSGSKTLSTTGKTVKQVFDMIVAEELAPKVTANPAVTTKIANNGTPGTSAISLECGTEVTPKYSATLSAGSYTYGPATGIAATEWTISDSLGNTSSDASGSFDSFKIAAGQTYKVSATAKHNGGSTPVTNLGNAFVEGHELWTKDIVIPAGSKSSDSPAITGYQQGWYIGFLSDKTTTIDSSVLRGFKSVEVKGKIGTATTLSNVQTANAAYAATVLSEVTVPVGTARIVIACPSGVTGVTDVLNTTVNANMTTSFTTSEVTVAGADNDTSSDFAAEYTVWVYQPATAYESNAALTITLG